MEQYDLNNALIEAAEKGDSVMAQKALGGGADVHVNDDWPLRLATIEGHTATVKVLLTAGADVSAVNLGALRWAGLLGHAQTKKVLLEAGADPAAALRAALKGETRKALDLLIDQKNKVDGEAEYASWIKVPAAPDRCPQCGRGVARLPMVNALGS